MRRYIAVLSAVLFLCLSGVGCGQSSSLQTDTDAPTDAYTPPEAPPIVALLAVAPYEKFEAAFLVSQGYEHQENTVHPGGRLYKKGKFTAIASPGRRGMLDVLTISYRSDNARHDAGEAWVQIARQFATKGEFYDEQTVKWEGTLAQDLIIIVGYTETRVIFRARKLDHNPNQS